MPLLKKQKAKLILIGKWKLSKQHSYLAGKFGRKYKNPAYLSEQQRMAFEMKPQLLKQKWKPTKNNVAIKITFHGPCMPVDWDNCGLLTDSMQGIKTKIGKKLIREPGIIVWDDNQFIPASVHFIKEKERKIEIEIESEVNNETNTNN